jgi:hypothetical protein
MKESGLQRRIRERLEITFPHSWWTKFHGGPFTRAGIPDLLGCVDGQFFAFEVKRPGKQPTAVQLKTISIIRQAGGVSHVVETPEEAVELVQRTLRLSAKRG